MNKHPFFLHPALIKRLCYFMLVISLSFITSACSNEDDPSGSSKDSYSEEDMGYILLENAKYLVINNNLGSVKLKGTAAGSRIDLRFTRAVTAETRQQAVDQINSIRMYYTFQHDTMIISVSAPESTPSFRYSAAYELNIPENIKSVVVDSISGEIVSTGLQGELTVKKGNGVTLNAQKGSCLVNSRDGEIAIEMYLPLSGYCKASTESGNITLRIPQETNSVINAQTSTGLVTYSDLTFSSLNYSRTKLNAVIGAGEGLIDLKSQSGNIMLTPINPPGEIN